MTSIETRLAKLEQIIPAVMPRPAGMDFDGFVAMMVEALGKTPPPADWGREIAPWLSAMTHDEVRRLRGMVAQRMQALEATGSTVTATTTDRSTL